MRVTTDGGAKRKFQEGKNTKKGRQRRTPARAKHTYLQLCVLYHVLLHSLNEICIDCCHLKGEKRGEKEAKMKERKESREGVEPLKRANVVCDMTTEHTYHVP